MRKTKPRILVVDDGLTMRLFYRSVLEAAGFQVEEAANGMEGCEKALAQSFELMIVDINMPKMDGYSMMRMIRDDPAVRMVPAVMISTEAGERDAAQALLAGANFYLVKPVAPEDLAEVARLMAGLVAE
jgi:two-component system, chemotaxis family, chemotaxis protein CheY